MSEKKRRKDNFISIRPEENKREPLFYLLHGLFLGSFAFFASLWFLDILHAWMEGRWLAILCLALTVAFELAALWGFLPLLQKYIPAGAALLALILNHWVFEGGKYLYACFGKVYSRYYHVADPARNLHVEMNQAWLLIALLLILLILLWGSLSLKGRFRKGPLLIFAFLFAASLLLDSFPSLPCSAGLFIASLLISGISGQSKSAGQSERLSVYAFRVGLLVMLGAFACATAEQVTDGMFGMEVSGLDDFRTKLYEATINHKNPLLKADEGKITYNEPVQSKEEELVVTADRQPEAPVYLKGFVGERFDNASQSWKAVDPDAFRAECEIKSGDNLSYEDYQREISAHLYWQLQYADCPECNYQVKNIRADHAYDWIPYGVWTGDIHMEGEAVYKYGSDGDVAGYLMPDTKRLVEYLESNGREIPYDAVAQSENDYVYHHFTYVPAAQNYLNNAYYRIKGVIGDGASLSTWLEAIQEDFDRRLTYSKEAQKTNGAEELIDNFYGVTRKGYCIHFASAATILLRMAGFPARYVTGYVAWPYDFRYDPEIGGYRASLTGERQHAWTEVYEPSSGTWMPVDLTVSHFDRNASPNPDEGQDIDESETAPGETEAEDTQTSEVSSESPETLQAETRSPDSQTSTGGLDDTDLTVSASKKTTPAVKMLILILLAMGGGIGYHFYKKKAQTAGFSENSKDRQRKRQVSRNEKLLSMQEEIALALQKKGLKTDPKLDDWAYAHWLAEVIPDLTEEESMALMTAMYEAAFGDQEIDDATYKACEAICKKICREDGTQE